MTAQNIHCPWCLQPLEAQHVSSRCPQCSQLIGPVRTRRVFLRDAATLALTLSGASALLAACDSSQTTTPARVVGVHDVTQAVFAKKSDDLKSQGWRPITMSMYGDPVDPRFAAVFVHGGPAWYGIFNYQFADAQTVFDQQVAKGFIPTIITANGAGSAARVSLVFEQHSGAIPLTHWNMFWGDISSPNTKKPATMMDYDAVARNQHLWLTSVTVYGTPENHLYGAIWSPNPAGTLWCCDAGGETLAAFSQRSDAQATQMARPAYITLSDNQQYIAVYRNDIPATAAIIKTDLTHDAYQTEFTTQVSLGLTPICLQGGGKGTQTRFAAIFVKNNTPQPRMWRSPTGFPAATAIDGVMQTVMQQSHVRAASLAVVQGTKLVVARGYTLAEADYPTTQPTTFFRIASCSKTITALAIAQLIAAGSLSKTQTMQDILHLTAPGGVPPSDPAFAKITVQDLLEMHSRLPPDYAENYLPITGAFGVDDTLPITGAQLASYLASQALTNTAYAYNNNGFTLLGQIVAKLRQPKIADPTQGYLQAIKDAIMTPLGITRCRLAVTKQSDQLSDEAHYDSSYQYYSNVARDLYLAPSQVAANQPLVPMQYGGVDNLEIIAGAGGLSMAMPDLARILAALNVSTSNPVLAPDKITEWLQNAAQADVAQYGSYGWDAVAQNGASFVADKGGYLEGSQNGIYFQSNGICFAVSWNYDQVGGDWYPMFPELLAQAQGSNLSSSDLFPTYGMASFGS